MTHRARTTVPSRQHELEEKRKLEKQREQQRRKNVIMRLNLLETYIRNHNIKVAFKDELNTASIGRIESEGEAKRVGSFLYWNVKGELTGVIVREDLNDFFLDDEEKDLAFTMLDMSGDGQVDLRECIQAVDAVFVDRHNLAATLKDGKAITKTIENLIGIVIHVVFIFFYLLVWEADVGSIWWVFDLVDGVGSGERSDPLTPQEQKNNNDDTSVTRSLAHSLARARQGVVLGNHPRVLVHLLEDRLGDLRQRGLPLRWVFVARLLLLSRRSLALSLSLSWLRPSPLRQARTRTASVGTDLDRRELSMTRSLALRASLVRQATC